MIYSSLFELTTKLCGVSEFEPPIYVEKIIPEPVGLYFVIPTSTVPPPNVPSKAPAEIGYPVSKTIPPATNDLFSSGQAVIPQLSAVEPVKVEKVSSGSIINGSVSS